MLYDVDEERGQNWGFVSSFYLCLGETWKNKKKGVSGLKQKGRRKVEKSFPACTRSSSCTHVSVCDSCFARDHEKDR